MATVRCTVTDAVVRYLVAQRIEIDGRDEPLFPGVFAIFGHGNVTCLGHSLEQARDELPTWRGQNEQGMALAACGFTKARRRRQIMVATSSIGPGATNMVTAAGVAMANRLPVLLLAGDTFQSRAPDPVLQQVEHFGHPSTTVNDAFRAVVRYWDRITHPAQVASSLPLAVQTMLDPADCGPAFVALPQDVQAMAFDYPTQLFETRTHRIRRPLADAEEVRHAVELLRRAERPLIIAGGGVHWSEAEEALASFVHRHGIPVVETVAGRTSMPQSHPLHGGPIGVTGCVSANALAADADVVLAVGTRLQDFTTGSWTVFGDEGMALIGLNTARFDAGKHGAHTLVGDARETLASLSDALGDHRAPAEWQDTCRRNAAGYHAIIDELAAPGPAGSLPTYAQVVGAVDRLATDDTYVVTAAGGFPGELVNGWRSDRVHSFDTEYGFSCMGYEIAGGWGAAMADSEREVIVLVGDGSYLMMNSDLYSSVLTGHRLTVIVCDNGGYAVINRLQVGQGGAAYNNMLDGASGSASWRVDFAAHAASMGCRAETVETIAELEDAIVRARGADRTTVIAMRTDPDAWTEGGAFWEVGVPEVSERPEVRDARRRLDEGKAQQRLGW